MFFSDKFIKASPEFCDMEKFVPAPYIRKSFFLENIPSSAEITICGLGFYELYINGKEITKGPLAPNISNHEQVIYYDNYDASEYLNVGENVIGIILGNGWRNPYGGFMWNFDKAESRGPVTMALCFEAVLNDKKMVLEADENFKTHSSPILYDDLRMGYCYDARLEMPGWNEPGFDDSEWESCMPERTPKGEKRLCEIEPIVVEKELEAVEIKHYDRLPFAHYKWGKIGAPVEDSFRDNVYVYDFGINTSGVTKIKVNGKLGQKITVRHGEETINGGFSINTTVFQRGEVNSKYYRDYAQVDTFICKGGYEEFIPKFKYDGFRYAYIEGLEPHQATKDAVTYLVMHSDIKRKTDFRCSDSVLNALFDCAINSDYSNFFYIPTDCPHREKLGWTNDAWVSSEQFVLNLTTENSLREWLFNIRKTQLENGALPCIVPTVNWGYDWGSGPAADAICVQLPYYLYKYTGDKEVIVENSGMIVRYFEYLKSRRDEDGLFRFGLGDWLDPYEAERGYIASPLEFVATALMYDAAKKAEFLFGQAEMEKEKIFAEDFAAELKKSIRASLIDFETMTVSGECQTSQSLAIAYGIFEPEELEAASARLIEIIHRDDDTIACGMFGLRQIFNVLSNIGEGDLAYKMITSKGRTGFGYWIESGATSLWERFKWVDDISSDNSKNHHLHGHISSWFIQDIAGLKPNPNADDISYFEIAPGFLENLSNAQAHYDSPLGKVAVRWERKKNGISLWVNAPKGTKGIIRLKSGYSFAEGEVVMRWTAEKGCDIEVEI